MCPAVLLQPPVWGVMNVYHAPLGGGAAAADSDDDDDDDDDVIDYIFSSFQNTMHLSFTGNTGGLINKCE